MAEAKPKAATTFTGRFCSSVYTFKTAWGLVAQAMWRRYPNPYSKHVLSEDVLSRSVENRKLFSRRLLRKTNKTPKWMEKFFGQGTAVCIVEESMVDAAAKTFTTYTRNINFNTLLFIEEKCVYYVSPENDNWTCCQKQAWVKCSVMGLSRPVEKFGADRYRKNVGKAELGLEYMIERLFHLPKFKAVTAPPQTSKKPSTA